MDNTSTFDQSQDLDLVVTNPDCIFYFDDVFDADIMEKINGHDWLAKAWEAGWTYHGMLSFGDQTYESLSKKISNIHSTERPFAGLGVLTAAKLLERLDTSTVITKHIGSYWTIQESRTSNSDQIHRDCFEFRPAWSVLFHLVGNSGPTEFYHSFSDKNPFKLIDFKPGRAIIFPCLYAHRAGEPNDSLRVCHSVRLEIDSVLNKGILSNCPNLANKYPQTIEYKDQF